MRRVDHGPSWSWPQTEHVGNDQNHFSCFYFWCGKVAYIFVHIRNTVIYAVFDVETWMKLNVWIMDICHPLFGFFEKETLIVGLTWHCRSLSDLYKGITDGLDDVLLKSRMEVLEYLTTTLQQGYMIQATRSHDLQCKFWVTSSYKMKCTLSCWNRII